MHWLDVSYGDFTIHSNFSYYVFYDLGVIESYWAGTENMLLSTAAHEDI